ncbi:hypothetical protein [Amycolatopsis sp. NPDC051128]|uniref:hypothetical protein n=1 Tax=Amycolatopsis sp. NPDC051128 TaxID=3155412 RepID=UPI003440C0B4
MNVGLVLSLVIGCLAAGTALTLVSRRRNGTLAVLLIVSLVGATTALFPATPAHATTSDCGADGNHPAGNSLTVTQTSTMDHLAPGVAPVPITGLVVNNGDDSTYLAAVEVQITSVTPAPGSPAGSCDAGDYLLVNARMPVARALGPGGSAPFTGAAIGFRNKTVNQDSCQNATIHLLYTANPD